MWALRICIVNVVQVFVEPTRHVVTGDLEMPSFVC